MKKIAKKVGATMVARLAISSLIKTEVEAMMRAFSQAPTAEVLRKQVARNLEQALRSVGEGLEEKKFAVKDLANAALFSPSSEKHNLWEAVRAEANKPISFDAVANALRMAMVFELTGDEQLKKNIKVHCANRWPSKGAEIDMENPESWTSEQVRMIHAAWESILFCQSMAQAVAQSLGTCGFGASAYGAHREKRKE